MSNKSGEGFLLTSKLYKSANNAAILDPKNQKMKGDAYVHPEQTAIKKQQNTAKKQIATWKIHANEVYEKLGHPGGGSMCANAKHPNYIVKGELEVFKY